MKHIFLFFLMSFSVMTVFVSCSGSSSQDVPRVEVDIDCCCPHATIRLQPYDDFTQKEAEQLRKDMQAHLDTMIYASVKIEVLPGKHLPDSFLNAAKTRYRADKIINSLKSSDKHVVTIGLTHKDISIPYKGKADWGVMGLSFRPSTACAVSSYRAGKKNLWKVASHEFIHSFYSYGHCPEDNPHCLMQDAKGKNPMNRVRGLCPTCKSQLG